MTVDLWSTYSTVCPVCPACVPAPPSVFLRTDHNFARFGQLRDHFSACRLLAPLPFFCPTSCCNSSTVQAGAVRMAWQQAHGSVNARSSLKKLTLWMLYLPIFADSVSAQSAPPSTAPPPPPPLAGHAPTHACFHPMAIAMMVGRGLNSHRVPLLVLTAWTVGHLGEWESTHWLRLPALPTGTVGPSANRTAPT